MDNVKLAELHEEIFSFLYSKHEQDPNFLFRLRSRNNNSSLDKGYWFIGNDGYLTITFWAKNDYKSRRPYIRLNILPYESCISYDFISKTSPSLRLFFKDLAEELGIPQHPKHDHEWHKILQIDKPNYLELIDSFIENEKKVIDKRLSEALSKGRDVEKLDFIDKSDFDRWIDNIDGYREENR